MAFISFTDLKKPFKRCKEAVNTLSGIKKERGFEEKTNGFRSRVGEKLFPLSLRAHHAPFLTDFEQYQNNAASSDST